MTGPKQLFLTGDEAAGVDIPMSANHARLGGNKSLNDCVWVLNYGELLVNGHKVPVMQDKGVLETFCTHCAHGSQHCTVHLKI